MPSDPYYFPLKVYAADIDFMGHVNNAIYLRWVQDAVLDHWRRLAPPVAIDAFAWVAVKHEITYRKPAFLADTLVAVARLEAMRRESAFYETMIYRHDEILAEAKSRWCCLDSATLKPTRLPSEVIERFMNGSQ